MTSMPSKNELELFWIAGQQQAHIQQQNIDFFVMPTAIVMFVRVKARQAK